MLSCKDVGQDVCLAWGSHCARCTSGLIFGVKITEVCGRAASASGLADKGILALVLFFLALLDLLCVSALLFRVGY